MSESKAVAFIAPNGGVTHSIQGMTIHVMITGLQSGGEFVAMEVAEPPGSASPTTWHKRTTSLFYVISGVLSVTADGGTTEVGAGGCAYLPPATVYAIANKSDRPVRYLLVSSPAGIENYIAESVAIFNSEPSLPPEALSKLSALQTKYDFFEPPVG